VAKRLPDDDDPGGDDVAAPGLDQPGAALFVAGLAEPVERVVVRGEAPPLPARWDVQPFSSLAAEPERPFAPPSPDDLALLIYTSGTTGASKGCMISHGYACQHMRSMLSGHLLDRNDVVHLSLPFFHLVAPCGLTLAAAEVGAQVALIPRFSASAFWREIERYGATFTLLVGSMLSILAKAPESEAERRCRGQLRTVCGGPFTPAISDLWRDRFAVARIGTPGYGLTEASIITRHPLDRPQPERTSGKRFSDYDVRIRDDSGRDCDDGEAGEIWVRSLVPHGMFDGYWGRPEETLAVLRDGWFRTGDIGMFDAEGFFRFLDRKKDYLRKGGENISSLEVEAVFLQHPDLADVAVHAVPSPLGEDEVKLTYVIREGADVDPRELCTWAIARLPAFVVPRFYEARGDLPRTPTGKVRKFELRENSGTAREWDREASEISRRSAAPSSAVGAEPSLDGR
jgi:crotonobetaine/carnitine-CoA ligase